MNRSGEGRWKKCAEKRGIINWMFGKPVFSNTCALGSRDGFYGGSALATKALPKPEAMTQKSSYSVLALSVLCAVMSSVQAKTYEDGFELALGW